MELSFLTPSTFIINAVMRYEPPPTIIVASNFIKVFNVALVTIEAIVSFFTSVSDTVSDSTLDPGSLNDLKTGVVNLVNFINTRLSGVSPINLTPINK